MPSPHFIAGGCRGPESFNYRSVFSIYHVLLLVCLTSLSTGSSKSKTMAGAASYLGAWQVPGRAEPHAVSENTAQAAGFLHYLLTWEKLGEHNGLALRGRPTHSSGADLGETLH